MSAEDVADEGLGGRRGEVASRRRARWDVASEQDGSVHIRVDGLVLRRRDRDAHDVNTGGWWSNVCGAEKTRPILKHASGPERYGVVDAAARSGKSGGRWRRRGGQRQRERARRAAREAAALAGRRVAARRPTEVRARQREEAQGATARGPAPEEPRRAAAMQAWRRAAARRREEAQRASVGEGAGAGGTAARCGGAGEVVGGGEAVRGGGAAEERRPRGGGADTEKESAAR